MRLAGSIQTVLSILLCLSVVFVFADSLTSQNSTHELQRRECTRIPGTPPRYSCDYDLPTLAQLVARYRDTNDLGRATPQNRVWFFTNLGFQTGQRSPEAILGYCLGWMMWQNIPSYYVNDGCNQDWYRAQKQWITSNEDEFTRTGQRFGTSLTVSDILQLCYYEAAAVAAQASDAYLFTKTGEDWRPESIWATVEYPALTQNPNIKRIWRVDPLPESPDCGNKVLMWDATHGDKPIDAYWKCPV